jgi:hypothetical protein
MKFSSNCIAEPRIRRVTSRKTSFTKWFNCYNSNLIELKKVFDNLSEINHPLYPSYNINLHTFAHIIYKSNPYYPLVQI